MARNAQLRAADTESEQFLKKESTFDRYDVKIMPPMVANMISYAAPAQNKIPKAAKVVMKTGKLIEHWNGL